MLIGKLPYGTAAARTRTRAQQRRLRYASASSDEGGVPDWIDGALHKATHPEPSKRYEDVLEFVYDLRHPNPAFLGRERVPLYERNPLLFWKVLSLILALAVVYLLAARVS